MKLRSKSVLRVHDALAVAASEGYGLQLHELKRLIPSNRNVFGVIWELRRWGAETISVKKGRSIVGWVLKADLPEAPVKMDEPTDQESIPYTRDIFRSTKRGPTSTRPLTVAAQRILAAA